MLVNLASLTVLSEQASEDTLSPHPLNLGGHTSLFGTLSLTGAGVSASTLGGVKVTSASPRVANDGLLDDLSIFNELSNVGARVGVANVVLLGRVAPDLSLANTENRSGQTLLTTEVDHFSCCETVRGGV